MAWATEAEVLGITGVTVTAAALAAADAVITIYAGVTDAATLKSRDSHWLKQATAWQSIWQKEQPGYTERHAVQEISQDGLDITYSDQAAHTASIMLAPLAIRTLKNLSWKKGRALPFRQGQPVKYPTDVMDSDADGLIGWEQL